MTAAEPDARSLRERRIAIALFVLWCAVTLVVTAHHEPWRDEADTWLMARDCSFAELWRLMHYGGTLLLWYLIELPFARAGAPYVCEQMLHWPIAATMAGLLLLRARIPLLPRALFAFGALVGYEFTSIARAYSLTVLFLFAVCALWPKRANSIWFGVVLALLANTTPAGLFFAASAALVVVVERASARALPSPASALIAAAGIALAFLQLWPTPPDPQVSAHEVKLIGVVHVFARGMIPYGAMPLRIAGAIVVVAAALWLARHSRAAIAVFALFFALLTVLFAAFYGGHLRNWGFYFVDVIALLWLADARGTAASDRIARAVITLACGAWFVAGVQAEVAELAGTFSNSEAMGHYLADQHLDESALLVAHRPPEGESVLPYLRAGTSIYDAALDATLTHMLWDRALFDAYTPIGARALVLQTRAHLASVDDERPVYMLLSDFIPGDEARAAGLVFVHSEDEPTLSPDAERLWLYSCPACRIGGAPKRSSNSK